MALPGKNSCSQSSTRVQVASTVKDKKVFLKYLNSKQRTRENTGMLIDGVSHLTNRDTDNAEVFNAFFASVFNTNTGPWDPRRPVLEDRD